MNTLLEFIVMLSRWCNSHLNQITLAIVAVLLVLFGSILGKYLKRLIGNMNIVLRVTIIAICYLLVFGLIINYLPSLLRNLFNQLNYYSLLPILLLVTILLGMIADRR